MRLREISSGIIVHVDDARGDAMIGAQWELADKPLVADQKAEDKPRASARKRNSKVE